MKDENILLCIEDNAGSRQVVERVGSSIGMSVLLAQSAEEGLELAEQHQPSLILMDVALPGMDGITATQELKANPVTADIPVIIVTGSDNLDSDDCAEIGCLEILQKPLKLGELMLLLHKYNL